MPGQGDYIRMTQLRPSAVKTKQPPRGRTLTTPRVHCTALASAEPGKHRGSVNISSAHENTAVIKPRATRTL